MPIVREIQLGKSGVTESFIENLKNQFNKTQNVKISVLRSCCRDKSELDNIKNNILEHLGKNYTARAIGYTLALKKWRKEQKE